jgi:hypothetical protein
MRDHNAAVGIIISNGERRMAEVLDRGGVFTLIVELEKAFDLMDRAPAHSKAPE